MTFLDIPMYLNQNSKLKRVVSDLLKCLYNCTNDNYSLES